MSLPYNEFLYIIQTRKCDVNEFAAVYICKENNSEKENHMDDLNLIELYWQRSEDAVAETAAKYGSYCYRIAYNVLANNEDSEECVNDTFLKVWESIPPNRPNRFSVFIGKITRHLALNRYEYLTAAKRGGSQVPLALDELSDCIPDHKSPTQIVEDKELSFAINKFLRNLSSESRKIFLQRYWGLRSIKDISVMYGITESKVKMSLMRTRNKFKHFLEREGIEI